MNTALNTSHSD